MIGRSRAFSLIELVIGLFILSLVGIMLGSFLKSASHQSDFGAEHFTAILLAQKVIEDCAQEIVINPHAFSTLGLEATPGSPISVVNGQSPFFTVIQDSLPPFGEIDPGGIDENLQPLFSQVRDFSLEITAKRQAPTGPLHGVYSARIGFSWKSRTGKGKYSIDCSFPSLVGEKKAGLLMPPPDPTDLEKEIAKAFFGDVTKTLPAIISEQGGDENVIRAMGTVHLLGRSFFRSSFVAAVTRDNRELSAALASTVDPIEISNILKRLEKNHFDLVRASFRLLWNFRPQMELIMANWEEARLGTALWNNRQARMSWIDQSILVWKTCYVHLMETKKTLERQLEKRIAAVQDLQTLHGRTMKLIDLNKILTVVPGSPLGSNPSYFRFLQQSSIDRNPCVRRFMVQDEEFLTAGKLQEKYPNLKTIGETFRIMDTLNAFIADKGLGSTP